jgi:hypothetical protein
MFADPNTSARVAVLGSDTHFPETQSSVAIVSLRPWRLAPWDFDGPGS